MLSREICYRCLNNSYPIDKKKEALAAYTRLWDNHKLCPCLHSRNPLLPIASEPPKRCPYVLEQTVNKNA